MPYRAVFMLILASTLVFPALAADPTGKWSATFDTMIGQQKYTYEFKLVGDKLTGNVITFVETFNFQGNDIRIEYTGKISGDEIKFTRKVAEYATEELVAK